MSGRWLPKAKVRAVVVVPAAWKGAVYRGGEDSESATGLLYWCKRLPLFGLLCCTRGRMCAGAPLG